MDRHESGFTVYLPSTFQRFDLNRIAVTDDGKHPPSPSDGSVDNGNESQRLRYCRVHTLAAIREPKTRHRHHVLDITYTAIWHANTGCSTNTAHPPHDVTFSSLCSEEEKSVFNHNNYEERDTLSKVRGNVDFST